MASRHQRSSHRPLQPCLPMDSTRGASEARSSKPQGSSSLCPPPPILAPSEHPNGTPPHDRPDIPYPHPLASNNGVGLQATRPHHWGAVNNSLPPPASANPYHQNPHPHRHTYSNQGQWGNPLTPFHPPVYPGPPRPDFRRLPPILPYPPPQSQSPVGAYYQASPAAAYYQTGPQNQNAALRGPPMEGSYRQAPAHQYAGGAPMQRWCDTPQEEGPWHGIASFPVSAGQPSRSSGKGGPSSNGHGAQWGSGYGSQTGSGNRN